MIKLSRIFFWEISAVIQVKKLTTDRNTITINYGSPRPTNKPNLPWKSSS